MFDFLNFGVYLTAQIRVFKCQLLDGKIIILLSIVLSIQTEYTEFCQEERNHSKNKEMRFLSMVGSSFILYILCLKQTLFLPTFWKLFPHHDYIVHVGWNLLSSFCRPNSSSHAKCCTCRRSDFSQIGDP